MKMRAHLHKKARRARFLHPNSLCQYQTFIPLPLGNSYEIKKKGTAAGYLIWGEPIRSKPPKAYAFSAMNSLS